jgi:hypothetical protein
VSASDAYVLRETVQLAKGKDKKLAAQTDDAIQVKVTQGSVRFEAKGKGGITPTGCGNRCLKQLASDSINTNELTGLTLSGGQGSAALHAKVNSSGQPVKVNAELAAGEFIEYSGDFAVTITGTSSSAASLTVSFSGTELVDP